MNKALCLFLMLCRNNSLEITYIILMFDFLKTNYKNKLKSLKFFLILTIEMKISMFYNQELNKKQRAKTQYKSKKLNISLWKKTRV